MGPTMAGEGLDFATLPRRAADGTLRGPAALQAAMDRRGVEMRILKWLFALVVALLAVRLIGGALLSPRFSVVRSVGVAAPPDKAAESTGTRVTWTMNGDMGANLLYRWMTLFVDRMVGKDFEAGLANLKARAERP